MVRQLPVVLVESVAVELLDGPRRPLVERSAALHQQRSVRHLLCQRVLEDVLGLGKGRLLVDELSRLEAGKPPAEIFSSTLGHPAEQAKGELLADH